MPTLRFSRHTYRAWQIPTQSLKADLPAFWRAINGSQRIGGRIPSLIEGRRSICKFVSACLRKKPRQRVAGRGFSEVHPTGFGCISKNTCFTGFLRSNEWTHLPCFGLVWTNCRYVIYASEYFAILDRSEGPRAEFHLLGLVALSKPDSVPMHHLVALGVKVVLNFVTEVIPCELVAHSLLPMSF